MAARVIAPRKVYLSTAHGGFGYKELLKAHLTQAGHEVVDLGNCVNDPQDDYPDFIIPMAEAVRDDAGSFGIVLGRSGNGEAIAANKVRGIRAALCLSTEMARKAREHNNAQVLSIGGDYVSEREVIAIAEAFLATEYAGEERHQRRIEKILRYEGA